MVLMQHHPDRPRRLDQIFRSYDTPVYFITFNTFHRKQLLASNAVHDKFITFARQAEHKGVAMGRYVIMPDHIHCFIRIVPDKRIGTTIRLLKRSLSTAIEGNPPHWQPGFFDHVLRHGESYAEKWEYVRQNPVRAGLVKEPNEWLYQGQIVPIRF
jgi:REP element-mobilizing transposase RayT